MKTHHRVILSLIIILCLLLLAYTTLAGSASISITIDATDPNFDPKTVNCSLNRFDPQFYTELTEFKVTATGTYTVTYSNVGTGVVGSVHTSPYDFGDPRNSCVGADADDFSLDNTYTVNLMVGQTYISQLVNNIPNSTTNPTITISGPGDVCFGSCSSSDGIPLPAFYDDRINNYDTAAPIAIYPHLIDEEIGLIIYDVDGVELLIISPQQIVDAPENPESNVLVATANGITLYRVSGDDGGLWQINAPQYNGKTYVMIFPELFHSGGYQSFEVGD